MVDLIGMLTNLRTSLGPVQEMVSGLAYVIGISLVVASLFKFRVIAHASPSSPSQEKMFVPVTYLAIGAGLIFFPTSFSVLSNTVFGSENVLAYSDNNEETVTSIMTFFIQTAGVLWFVRGSTLLVHASEPGVKDGSKGITFIISGIFAMNFEGTVEVLDHALTYFFTLMTALKNNIRTW